jgi:CubicO group peptidase (beta-lactamase class C family)
VAGTAIRSVRLEGDCADRFAPDAFGHLGSGGARALAVPSKRLAVCFVSNYQSEQRSIGVRTEEIVEAAAACVA